MREKERASAMKGSNVGDQVFRSVSGHYELRLPEGRFVVHEESDDGDLSLVEAAKPATALFRDKIDIEFLPDIGDPHLGMLLKWEKLSLLACRRGARRWFLLALSAY